MAAKRERGEDFELIDVREPHEHEIARIDGARLIPLGSLMDVIPTLDPSREVVVFCKVGLRSEHAALALQRAGFGRVWNLAGGITRYSDDVDPAVPKY
jgi:adenylyltransferase/sulfurtransferase